MKNSEKNNINHILRKWYHIDFSQKSPEIPIIDHFVQKFTLFVFFEKKIFEKKKSLKT